jgi:metal-sulfur cluster biosynthetic enzyme
MKNLLKQNVITILKTIPDPELTISIWDLGLVYEVTVDVKGNIHILMTLTSIGCPLFSMMEVPIKEKVMKLKGVKSVSIDLTFDPAWSVDKMSRKARVQLGI